MRAHPAQVGNGRTVSLLVAILIVVGVTGFAIVAMLLVRRNAPDGSYFHDSDRAAGVFGVLATGFAVLLGFVVFLSFTSYDAARAGAESEARIVAQQVETAQLFPPAVSAELTAELVCYARSVAGVQWDRMEAGTLREDLNPWAVRLFETLQGVEPETPTEQAAYSKWLDERSAREDARDDRIHGAIGVIPSPLWVVLFFTAALIFIYMLFFADSGERAGDAGAAHGDGGLSDRVHAAAPAVPQQSLSRGDRWPPPRRDGTNVEDHRPGARRCGGTGGAAVRRPRKGAAG